jgi:DNA-binding GntR family transcriptional regulator
METLNLTGVTESIVRYLRINIIEGKLTPGQKLNEIELAEKLGISRPPLREAFRILENEHLIISLPRKGCYVTEVSLYDCRQIYKVREMLECGVIDCLEANNIVDLPDVTSAFELAAQRSATVSNDIRTEAMEYQNPFPLFHINLVASTKNNWLIRFYNKITPTLARYQFMCYVPDILSKIQEEHKQILDLIKKEKYDSAKKLLRNHINWYIKFLEKRIRKNING